MDKRDLCSYSFTWYKHLLTTLLTALKHTYHTHTTGMPPLCACVRYWPYHGDGSVLLRSVVIPSPSDAFWQLFCSSQPKATTWLRWSWRLKECFCTRLGSWGYAMPMSTYKGETAVYGFHWPSEMDVHMCTVLAIPQGWFVCFRAVTSDISNLF